MALSAYLTNAGYQLLNQLLASQGTLTITKAELGSGVCTGEDACRARTTLVNRVCDATLTNVSYEGGEAKITVQYYNDGLVTGFFVNELGIYAKHPTTGANILYCYVTFGNNPDWIAPESSAQYVRTYDVKTIISSLEQVTIVSSPSALISREEFNNVIAPEFATNVAYVAGAFVLKGGNLYRAKKNISAGAWNANDWENRSVAYYLERNEQPVTKPRFGVSGVGNSTAALTRLWDSVGKTATPGTDTVAASSDFDGHSPFNRRKCVGTWALVNEKPVFTVAAYQGDADFAEDGSKGDYVAVDVTPFYYYEQDGILGVSEQQFPGWKLHPVCANADGTPRLHTYLPCYSLGVKDGKAVSLPNTIGQAGSYYDLRTKARTYGDASLANFAIIEPSAVNHYEWLLFTIEFATQNCQSVMNGAVGMFFNDGGNSLIVTAPAANKVVMKSAASGLVIGQYINIASSAWGAQNDITKLNRVTNLQRCTEDGALDESGSCWLVTYDGEDRTASITIGTTQLNSYPWANGACGGFLSGIGAVLGHTGSPISNTSGKYPMMYRWRENVYGNQYSTSVDLMDVRVDEGNEVYHLEWYFLPDPTKYMPANSSMPDLAALNNPDNGWEKLSVITPNSSYTNGYIRKEDADERFPHVHVPVLTTGGGSATYTCDYAYLVSSYVVRSVRRGGILFSGASAGLRCVNANYAPSNGCWNYGGGLYFIQ